MVGISFEDLIPTRNGALSFDDLIPPGAAPAPSAPPTGVRALSDADLMRQLGAAPVGQAAPPPTLRALSDADLLRQLGAAPPAAPSAQSTTGNVFDQFDAPNPFDQFDVPDAGAPAARMAPAAQDPDLGPIYAPGQTAPAPTAPTNPSGAPLGVSRISDGGVPYAAASSAMDAVPVLGPALTGASNQLAAGIRSLRDGTHYADELRAVEGWDEAQRAAHPVASTAGSVAGSVAGAAPLMAAPVAFGLGEGALASRAGLSALTNSAMGVADATARGRDSLTSGAVAGVLGGAAPLAGAAGSAAARTAAKYLPQKAGGLGYAATRDAQAALQGECRHRQR